MGIKQQAIKGIFWSGIQNWGSQAGSLIIFLVLARILSPADFGLVALANTFLAFFNIFIEQGFSSALIQRQEVELEHLNTAFWTQICFGIAFTILSFNISNLIAGIFQQPTLTPILKWMSVLFSLNSLSIVQRTILKRQLEFQKMAIRSLSGIFMSGIVGISLALLDYGVWSLVGQQLTFEIVGVVAFWSLSDWKPKLQFSLAHFRDLFGFGISIFGSKILTFFNRYTDNLLIGYFLGEVALGYYAVAYRVLQVLTQLLVSTGNQVALPVLSRFQGDPDRFLRVFYKIIKYASLIALPVFLGVVTLARELVVIIFGVKWEASISIMQVLAFGGIIYLILFFNRSVFVAVGKPFWRLRLELLNVSFNIIACMVAVRYGILAVAFAYVISDFLVIPASLWSLKQLVGISWQVYFKQLISPVTCTSIMITLIWVIKYLLATRVSPQIIIVLCTLSGILFYTLFLRFLAPLLFQELWQLAKLGLFKSNPTKI
ncbi:MAG: lipopolysaccharide biosynthesis protein [Xenococcus sp. MO_188.B8]|nr:lipopolysaccharide biosynthesis protein [Xenococcus sp. MO_188.B8]